MYARLALLAALASVFCGIATPAAVPELADVGDDESERIIGGTDAYAGQFPWMVALIDNGIFICTASIIGNSTILTAAHCVVDRNGKPRNPSDFHLIAHFNRSSPSLRINVTGLIVHENYGNFENDIAIFKTNEPITFNEDIQPICIARLNTTKNEYTNATAMGWGNTRRASINYPDIFKYVKQSIVYNQCYLFFQVKDSQICATDYVNGVCNGDSGGPLVHLSADKPPVQIGVTSYGHLIFGCGRGAPSVWTRVSYYFNWIKDNSNGDVACVV